MPFVRYEATDFPPEYQVLRESPPLFEATWPEIVHAAVTVGRRGWRDVAKHGSHSVFEMVYRAFMVYANLAGAMGGGLYKTAANEGLDPSEKSAISYFLGLTFTKLVVGRLLDVHWVMHLDVYAQYLQAVAAAGAGARRPDMVGRDATGRWHVFEAKGRTNAATVEVLESAKEQARALGTIRGVAPHLCVASVTHFRRGGLEVCLADPEVDGESIDLDISEIQFARDYYEPFVTLLDQNPTEARKVDGRSIRLVEITCADIKIGLDEETLAQIEAGRAAKALTWERESEAPEWTLGKDGVFVELGPATWAPQLMGLEPPKRK